MPTRSVVMNSFGVARDPAGVMPFAFDTDRGQLVAKTRTSGPVKPVAFSAPVAKTASFTAVKEDDGAVFIADSATSVAVTLPLASTCPGARFTVVVGQLTSSGGHGFTPNAADTIRGNGLSKTAGQSVVCSAASDRVGDVLEIVSDGSTSWYIVAVTGTWA